jgi:hypothetical protein
MDSKDLEIVNNTTLIFSFDASHVLSTFTFLVSKSKWGLAIAYILDINELI